MPRRPSIKSIVENLYCDSILCKPIAVDWAELSRGEPGYEVILPTEDEDEISYQDYKPKMNYAYPLVGHGSLDPGKIKDLPLVLVEMNGDYYLALTAGGMDCSWEICAAYIRLGFCPPFHFCASLPRMAQTMNRDMRLVIAGAKKTLSALESRVRASRNDVNSLEKWYRERNKKSKVA